MKEYKILTVKMPHIPQDVLNNAASDGWTLVNSLIPANISGEYVFVLERDAKDMKFVSTATPLTKKRKANVR